MSASYVLWKTTRHKEADVMNTKDNREDNIKLTQIADLTVSEDLAAEVKGGPRAGGGGGGHVIVFDIIDSCP